MRILSSRDELLAARSELRELSIGLVPTMGFLHEGHISLMRRSAADNDVTIATIFVNPTQFNETADLDTYPRDPDGDAQKCRDAGVDILWMPEVRSVYAADHSTTVSVAGVTDALCGASRPGHFDGVATIVCKLLHLARPARAYFGEKDYQQLAMIRRMVRDLDMQLELVGMPIVRDTDGVALSSRNKHLSATQRRQARCLREGLEDARLAWQDGERNAARIRALIRERIERQSLADVDYVDLVGTNSITPFGDENIADHSCVAAVAVRFGETRLIDNARLDRSQPVWTP